MVTLNFLGTSHGVPEADRFCSGTALQVNGAVYLIDAGFPIVKQFRANEVSIDKLKSVFITHYHSDHTGGLPHFTDLLVWYFTEVRPTFFVPDKAIREGVFAWNKSVDNDYSCLKFEVYKEGIIYTDENITVTAYPNLHMNGEKPSYSFLIETDGKKILFTGDLNANILDMPKIAFEEELDAIIFEGAHNKITDVKDILYRLKTKKLILNHIYWYMNPEETFVEFGKKANYECIYSHDNDVLVLE